ncbi:MAG: TorF family putative porin [Gallionellaceae bacterium]
MKKNKLVMLAIISAFSLPSFAADFTPSSNVSLVSDYLYRGISQSGANPAIQGGFDVEHSNGFYAGVWASSISFLGDAGVTNSGTELDTYFGLKGSAAAIEYDLGFLRYNYPGNYGTSTKADTSEIYGAVSYSIVTAKLSYSLGDTFGVANAQGSTYLELNASYPIADSGVTLSAHYGVQTYQGVDADSNRAAGNDPTYADYQLAISKDFSGYELGLAASGTNAGSFYTSGQNKKLGATSAVMSITRSF